MRSLFLYIFLISCTVLSAQKKSTTKGKSKPKEKEHNNIFTNHTPHSRDFHGIGHSLFFDLNLAPLKPYTVIKNQDTTAEFSRLTEYSLYHISYFFRLNLIQPDDDRAFTFTLNPGIGLGLSQSKKMKGFGIFTGGAYFGWETGMGSTYLSSEEKGRFIRLGAEYSYLPLAINSQEKDNQEIKSFVTPAISFGFRKENPKQNMVETNIKIGMGLTKADQTLGSSSFVFYRAFNFRLSMVVYLDH